MYSQISLEEKLKQLQDYVPWRSYRFVVHQFTFFVIWNIQQVI